MSERLLLRASGLRVELDGKTLIRDLSLELREKEMLIILGPNGAGKTALLRALLGLLPHDGKVIWSSGTRIGYVPQRVPLNKDLPVTVEDFFALKRIAPGPANEAIRQVGIADPRTLNTPLGALSSGQFQRVLIAWALAQKPDILVFDEPMTGIDIGGEKTIRGLLRQARRERNIGVILVTHDIASARTEATTVLCLGLGKHRLGPPEETLNPDTLREIFGPEFESFGNAHG